MGLDQKRLMVSFLKKMFPAKQGTWQNFDIPPTTPRLAPILPYLDHRAFAMASKVFKPSLVVIEILCTCFYLHLKPVSSASYAPGILITFARLWCEGRPLTAGWTSQTL